MIPAWMVAMMESAAGPFTPLDLGAKLRAWWAPPSPGDNVTLNASAIASWIDEVGGYDLSQATAASQPAYDATGLGGLACAVFDGLGDHLLLAPVPAGVPTGSDAAEVWLSCRQDALVSDGGSRNAFSYGGTAASDRRQVGRWVPSGTNRALSVAGNGSGQVIADNDYVDFSGTHVVRAVFDAAFHTDVDETAGDGETLTLATNTTRLVMGINTGLGAGVSWHGAIRQAIVTEPLSAGEAAQMYAWLNEGL